MLADVLPWTGLVVTLNVADVLPPATVTLDGTAATDGLLLLSDTTAPAAARPDLYRPVSDTWPDYLRAEGDVNLFGVLSVGVPGTLKAWADAIARFGTCELFRNLHHGLRRQRPSHEPHGRGERGHGAPRPQGAVGRAARTDHTHARQATRIGREF